MLKAGIMFSELSGAVLTVGLWHLPREGVIWEQTAANKLV